MALLGHPVVGDSRYTYGYAQRHPDAPVRLLPRQAQQAKAHPFGVTSDHPYHTPHSEHVLEHDFWASTRSGASFLEPKGLHGAEAKQTGLVSSNKGLPAQSARMSVSPSPAQQDLQTALAQPALEQDLLHIGHAEAPCMRASHLVNAQAASESAQAPSRKAQAASSAQLPALVPRLRRQQPQLVSLAQSVSIGTAQSAEAAAGASSPAPQHPERQLDAAQEVLELRRPSQVAAVQPAASSMRQQGTRLPVDPGFIDLSINSQARMRRAAPYYTDMVSAHVADQQGPSHHMRPSMVLPAELQHVLCLWAVALMLPHPVTRVAMQLSIPDPDVFEKMRAAELQLAWHLRQQTSQ